MSPSIQARSVTFGFAALGAALLVFALMHAAGRAAGISPVNERHAMPLLAFQTLDGGTWRMEDHRGEVVVVNYWASWCGPCWQETPVLVGLAREDGPRGLAVVGVAMDEGGLENVRAFVERFGVSYPVALPRPMSQMAYGLEGLPTTILVDRRGRVAKSYSGAVGERQLRADVEVLLKEQ